MEPTRTLEEGLKAELPLYPHWQQLLVQGFWYGLISWTITCAEEGTNPKEHPLTIQELVSHADSHLETWPLDWLESSRNAFLDLHLNLEQLNIWFTRLDELFRDWIPVDLEIFSTLADGETLTEEQWERLYNALAFLPPDTSNQPGKRKPKTRRVKGRRALTPMRRHHHKAALTRHVRHPVAVLKMK